MTVVVPWQTPLKVQPSEVIGSNIWCYGTFDLAVTEAICRVLDPGETALDIGANIGLMTSLMCCCVGQDGRVMAFEPHPQLFNELQHNVANLRHPPQTIPELHNLALSDTSGEAVLDVGAGWSENRGLSRLAEEAKVTDANAVRVRRGRLDDLLPIETVSRPIVIKIDVEGHELKVFQGARRLLESHRVRDIIFEEIAPYPSPVHLALQNLGYRIYALHTRVLRPCLQEACSATRFDCAREGQNYLATLEPERVLQRFSSWGWRSLKAQRFS